MRVALIDLDRLDKDTNASVDMCADSSANHNFAINVAAVMRNFIDQYIVNVVDEDGVCEEYQKLGFTKIHEAITSRRSLKEETKP